MISLTFDGVKSRKRERIKELQKSKQDSSVDSSYFGNSEKEELCNEISRHFVERHPNSSHESFIVVKNEYDVPKCVCSTLKPELLPHPKLYDVSDCSNFVANFFEYEPLESKNQVPEYLPSPSQVIAWRTGDCFDIAVVLTSFLLGSNYDAYLVYGVAPDWVCKRDLTVRCDKMEACMRLNTSVEMEAIHAITSVLGENIITERNRDSEIDNESTAKKCVDINDVEHQSNSGIHCWVLVRPNDRCLLSRSEAFFIEPTTGTLYPCKDRHPYQKIFAIWNQMNYWVNQKPTNCSAFIFTSSDDWLPVFYNSCCDENVHSKEDGRLPFDPPLSWVRRLDLPRDLNISMYPNNGTCTYIMRNKKVEMYSDYAHKQNVLLRISEFEEEEMVNVSCCSERYGKLRSDGLLLRVRLFQRYYLYERFAVGNKYNIDTWIESTGKRRRIMFHGRSRLDNLTAYDEIFGQKIVHEYKGRRDCLARRTVHITWIDEYKEKVRDKLVLTSSDSTKNAVVLKVEEEFEHFDIAVDDDALRSRVFDMKEKKLELRKYHSGEQVVLTPESSRGSDSDMVNRQFLMESEKIITNSVRSLHLEYVDILRSRRRDEDPSSTSLLKQKSSHEDETEKNKIISINESKSEPDRFDYLGPFLITVKDEKNISREEAIQIHSACLEFTKARLLERADIIQLRLEEESKRLAEFQKQYNDSLLDDRSKQTEELERICNDITFKINILEKRLKQHEDTCISKLQSMENKLRHDPRLSLMFSE